MSSGEFRHLVRVSGFDCRGDLQAWVALTKIKGVNRRFALAVLRVLDIDPWERLGYLSEEDISRIDEVIKNPVENGIPVWFLNRRKDVWTGEDKHIVGADLIYVLKRDIDVMKKAKSWKGIRHALGLKVRGQKTRTSGRKGITIGVTKSKKEKAREKARKLG